MRKLWHDPVWSKVIAGVILAVGATVVSYLLTWGSVIDPLLTRVFAFTSSATSMPNWLIGILVLLLLAVALVRPGTLWQKKLPSSVGGVPHQIYLQRQKVHWIPYNEKVTTRYWAAGTSLVGVAERSLIQTFYRKGVRDMGVDHTLRS